VHGHYGLISAADRHAHDHATGRAHTHSHGETATGDKTRRHTEGHDERPAPDPHHGEGSLAHFAAAVLAPALFVLPPGAVEIERAVLLRPESVHVSRRLFGPVQARAPPA